MAKTEKLLDKIRNNPNGVRFDDICRLTEAFGFTCNGGKGSHRVYSKKGITDILNFQNVKGMAKPYQVRQLLRITDEHGLKLREE